MLTRLIPTVLFIVYLSSELASCGGKGDTKGKGDSKGKGIVAGNDTNDTAVVAADGLIFSHIIFRHGDRNPTSKTFPTDPFQDPKLYAEGLGQLTDNGKQRIVDLGKYLRRRYRNFVDNQPYSPNMIYARSTHMRRTLDSGSAFMAGFFGHAQWNDTVKTIRINVCPIEKDNILYFLGVPCDRYKQEQRKLTDAEDPKALKKYQKLYEYLEKNAGRPVRKLATVYEIYDRIFIEKFVKKFNVPDWMNKLLPPGDLSKDMEEAVQLYFSWGSKTREMARLRHGFHIRQMLSFFTTKTMGKQRLSLHVYSCHDSNIYGLLNTLKVHDMRLIPYGACILFELYKPKSAEGDYYVQLFYKNTTAEVIHPINIPDCGTECPLSQFYQIYSDILSSGNFTTECQI